MNKPNFSEETKELIYDAQNGFCIVKECYDRIVDFHHKLHNLKHYQEKFVLFLQSVFNCAGVCRKHHDNHSIHPELNISVKLAELYESYLRELKGSK